MVITDRLPDKHDCSKKNPANFLVTPAGGKKTTSGEAKLPETEQKKTLMEAHDTTILPAQKLNTTSHLLSTVIIF